jgi:quinoprotein glucose dehydrogenase
MRSISTRVRSDGRYRSESIRNWLPKGSKIPAATTYGGPVVTASGLLFIGATNFDKKFRAFEKLTGKLLWETVLPAAGNATPSIYEIHGRQYVVIVCGGGKNGAASGGSIVAFALPEK